MNHRTLFAAIAALLLAAPLSACCTSAPRSQPTPLTLQGQPSWFDLGGIIYQEGDVEPAEKNLLKFSQDPQWFKGYPRKVTQAEFLAAQNPNTKSQTQDSQDYYLPNPPPMPKKVEDLPTKSEDATLDFSISPTPDPKILAFSLTLKSSGRAILREKEHRWNNLLPFLFAIYVDGKAVQIEAPGFSKMGGANGLYNLVDAGGHRDWQLRLDADSLAAFLPDRNPHQVTLVAAFSERQHETFLADDHIERLADLIIKGQPRPQILLRSQPTTLQWTGTAWKSFPVTYAIPPSPELSVEHPKPLTPGDSIELNVIGFRKAANPNTSMCFVARSNQLYDIDFHPINDKDLCQIAQRCWKNDKTINLCVLIEAEDSVTNLELAESIQRILGIFEQERTDRTDNISLKILLRTHSSFANKPPPSPDFVKIGMTRGQVEARLGRGEAGTDRSVEYQMLYPTKRRIIVQYQGEKSSETVSHFWYPPPKPAP